HTPYTSSPHLSILKTFLSVKATTTPANSPPSLHDALPIYVANTGDVTLTGVTVTDPLTGNPAGQVSTLAVGGFEDLSASYTLTQAGIDNPSGPHTLPNTATADSYQNDPKDSSVPTPITYPP